MRKCKHCKHCVQLGRAKGQRERVYGRKYYCCEHPKIVDAKDKYGRIDNFIGYGDMTYESPLTLRGHKRFCPLEKDRK